MRGESVSSPAMAPWLGFGVSLAGNGQFSKLGSPCRVLCIRAQYYLCGLRRDLITFETCANERCRGMKVTQPRASGVLKPCALKPHTCITTAWHRRRCQSLEAANRSSPHKNLPMSSQPQQQTTQEARRPETSEPKLMGAHDSREVALPAGTLVVDVDCGGTELCLSLADTSCL